ncbi:WD40 repeat domain-containing protein [Actinacidiphila glaucinigra]|nr:WD40 repeat domain-containing protein [Actinacidiphila glaucinigra]
MVDPRHATEADHLAAGNPDAPTTHSFPAQLRRLRRERGLSLADLARRTHYRKGYLSKIETGAKRATVDVARLCDQVLRAEGALLDLVERAPQRAAGSRKEADGTAAQSEGACPYRGLSAFGPQDSAWFFGRERATAVLVERIFDRLGSGPLMLVAPSGAGKSSLLHAGLVPALRRGDFPMPGADRWPLVTLTPIARPLEELLEQTVKDLGITAEQLRREPAALLEASMARSGGSPAAPGEQRPPPWRPVVIVDQFEELFTACADEDERRAFVRVLAALAGPPPTADPHTPGIVVLGVRADFVGNCLDLPDLAPVFTDGLFVVPPMSEAELRASITRPAELSGLTLQPGLLPLLLRGEPGTARGNGSGDETPSGALPLLSHALLATWQQREGAELTVAGYERAGGIQGAIARTAETVFARLYPAEQRTIRRILSRLVFVTDGSGATRRRVNRVAPMGQFTDAEGAAAALDAFVRARLITLDRDTVEITHEALLHAWPRLRDWIHADRAGLLLHQQLAHAAAAWESEGRDPSALYRGTRLDVVRTWADESDGWSRIGLPRRRPPGGVDAAGGAGLPHPRHPRGTRRAAEHPVPAVRRPARRTPRPRQHGGLRPGRQAAGDGEFGRHGDPAQHARTPHGRRTAGARAGAVDLLQPDGHTLAATSTSGPVQLWDVTRRRMTATLPAATRAARAMAFAPDGREVAVATAGGTIEVRESTGAYRVTAALPGHRGAVYALAYSPDGRTLASAGADRTVRLWDLLRARSLDVLRGHTDGVLGVAFSPDGRTVVSGGIDRTVRLSDVRTGRLTATLSGSSDDINAVAWTPDGATVVGAVGDGTTRLWDVHSGRQTGVLAGHTDYALGVAVAYDGALLATAGFDQSVVLWNLAGPALTARPFTEVWQAQFSPDGSLLATADTDHTVRLWDAGRRRLVATLRGHTETVFSVAFAPDGRTLASAGSDGTVRLWDVAGHRLLETLPGHTGQVFAVAFAPDGRTLASAGSDRTVRLWDTADGRPLAMLTGHDDFANDVTFSPD